MSLEWQDICNIIQQRQSNDSALIKSMRLIQEKYNADYVIPHPDVRGEPSLPPLTPHIIAEAIDHTAMRAASVRPMVSCPPVDPGKPTGKDSVDHADRRRMAVVDDWDESRINILFRRGFRQLAGYATTTLVVMPDSATYRPRIAMRDPLSSFPDARSPEEVRPPKNVGFVYGRSAAWIRSNYPEATEILGRDDRNTNQSLWDLVEWIDTDDIVIGIAGPRDAGRGLDGMTAANARMELRRWKNRAGVVTAVCPPRVTMDRIASQVDHIVGMTDLMARMMALEIMAAEKAIFPDRYIIGREGQDPRIVGGSWKDGRTGEVNLLTDVDKIGELQSVPGPQTMPTIDRLERNASVSSGRVPQFGGETYGALRTGRGIDSLLGASTDPRVQELQETMEAYLPWLNEALLATYEGYWPERRYTHIPGGFTPSVHIDGARRNKVRYPIIGADLQGTTVAIAQLVGAGLMSAETGMELHPYVADAHREQRRRFTEKLDEAIQVSILERASKGGIPPNALGWLKRALAEGKPIEDALDEVQQKMQELQAAQAPPPAPGQAAPPETQPGLANPGEGAQMAPPADLPAPDNDVQGFSSLIRSLNARPRAS